LNLCKLNWIFLQFVPKWMKIPAFCHFRYAEYWVTWNSLYSSLHFSFAYCLGEEWSRSVWLGRECVQI